MATITTGANIIKERLSHAYLAAVVARAGCQLVTPPIDRVAVDYMVMPCEGRPALFWIQAKATTRLHHVENGRALAFELDRRSYDLLRGTAIGAVILVVFDMPNDSDEWLTVATDGATLRKVGYWLNMSGLPARPGKSVTVRIPAENVFNPEAVVHIFDGYENPVR